MLNNTSKWKMQSSAILLVLLGLTACATPEPAPIGEAVSEWDFDHKLQFKKTKYDENNYRLEVISAKKVNFQRMSAFLLRRSYLICGGYGYTLTMVNGIESVDYKRSSPHLIRGNLTAKIECSTK